MEICKIKMKGEKRMFIKTVRRQGEKIIELDKKLQDTEQEEINFLNNTVRDLLNLQDINNLGLSEEDKNKHRNIIINALVENCLDKINELSNTDESSR